MDFSNRTIGPIELEYIKVIKMVKLRNRLLTYYIVNDSLNGISKELCRNTSNKINMANIRFFFFLIKRKEQRKLHLGRKKKKIFSSFE
jgi:hypothetical protein